MCYVCLLFLFIFYAPSFKQQLASGMFLTVKGKSEIVLQFGCVGNNYKVNFVSPSGRLRGSNQQSAEVLKVASVLHEGYEAKANWLLEKM